MTVKRRVFSRDFKLQVLREIEAGKSQAQVAREHQVNQQILTRWHREHREQKERAFPGKGWAVPSDEARIAELERMGASNVRVLYYGADPALFGRLAIEEDTDVFFYGHGAEYREDWIDAMLTKPSRSASTASTRRPD